MKARIPSGTREKRLPFDEDWMQQRDALPRVRYSRVRRRLLVAASYVLFVSCFIGMSIGRLLSTAIAYRVIQGAIVIVTLYAILGGTAKFGLPMPSNSGQWMLLLMPLYFLALGLPRSVLAWTLRDAEPPEREPEPFPV